MPLSDVLAVSMDVVGRTGSQACKHAIILMAQSARLITPKSKARRPVERDEELHGAKYVELYGYNSSQGPNRLYEWMFTDPKRNLKGTFADATRIANRGLAQRSWFFGLWKLGQTEKKIRDIAGAGSVYTILTPRACGYVKENRLLYINKIMPGGWETLVALRAQNRIMAQAARNIQRKWESAARRQMKVATRALQTFFKGGGF
jgi:hypothetical protein